MIKNVFKDQTGFSLPEVLITVVISGILTLAGATIINLAAQFYAANVNGLQAEIEASRGIYLLKTYLSQAVDIRRETTVPLTGPGGGPAGDGRVRGHIRSANLGGTTGVVTNIAVFNRETALDRNASVLRPTGITFVGPNLNGAGAADDQGGALFIHGNGAGLILSADYTTPTTVNVNEVAANVNRIGRVVRFEASAADMRGVPPLPANTVVRQALDGDLMVSLQVSLTFRFHHTSDINEWCWHPNLGSAYCANNNLRGRDVVKSTTINFRNNRIYASNNDDPNLYPKSDYRLNGGLYFFLPRSARPPF